MKDRSVVVAEILEIIKNISMLNLLRLHACAEALCRKDKNVKIG